MWSNNIKYLVLEFKNLSEQFVLHQSIEINDYVKLTILHFFETLHYSPLFKILQKSKICKENILYITLSTKID